MGDDDRRVALRSCHRRHRVGWGGNPDKDASYLSITPAKNDGKTIFKMKVPSNVPVDGFWSISLYHAKGYFEKNADNAYSVNGITGKKDGDGGMTIQFGGCDGKIPNCVPTMEGWNYTVRMYRPSSFAKIGEASFLVSYCVDA
jgi:hypothetical protein